MSINVHLDNVLSTAQPFATKLGMVMHHHGQECHVKRLICYIKGQGHSYSEGSYYKK